MSNLANSKVFSQSALANLNVTADGAIVLIESNDIVTSANLIDMAQIVAALGPSATLTSGQIFGAQVLLAVDSPSNVGLYLWTASATGDNTIGANELQLLSVLDDTDIAAIALEATDAFTLADLTIRVGAAPGRQTLNMNATVRDELVFGALGHSQYGAIDVIGTDGVAASMFWSGVDKIDLSALYLGATNGLLINDIITINRTGAASQITDANASNFFYTTQGDFTSQQRAVVVEFDGDDINASSAGIQSRGRIFVDLNGDGQLNTLQECSTDRHRSGQRKSDHVTGYHRRPHRDRHRRTQRPRHAAGSSGRLWWRRRNWARSRQ